MDKKKALKKGVYSHNFIDRILTKFKMAKHGAEEKKTGNGSLNASGSGKKGEESEMATESRQKCFISWDTSKLTPDNLTEFSEQLEQFLDHVQTLKDIMFCTNEIPHILNEKLKKEALQLRNIFREVHSAAVDIERLQKQRCLVKKEKCLAIKKLDKLRDDEMKELESIIHAYAKPLHSKWEAIKSTQKAEVLENFMNEVTGRHRAIEILQELVRRKLSKMSKKTSTTPFVLKKNISSTNMNNKYKNQDKTTSNWNIPPFPDIEKFGQTIDKVVRGTTERDIFRVNRRKRQKELREDRRRQNNLEITTTSNNDTNGLDLQLVPLDNYSNEEAEDVVTKMTTSTTLSTRIPPIINIEFMSDEDSVSLSSSDFTIENFVQSGNTDVQSDLQNEMRNVLQALFGEIRQIPQIGAFPARNRHNNSGNDLRSPRTASH